MPTISSSQNPTDVSKEGVLAENVSFFATETMMEFSTIFSAASPITF